MKKQVILVADDYGLNTEINQAILHAYLSGALQATALMMGQPGTKEAVSSALEHPGLQIGWHLHLNDSSPVTVHRWPWGTSPARAGIGITLSRKSRELVRGEIVRQWQLFQETGLPCHFINSHHHIHSHPWVYQTLVDTVGSRFKGWIRSGRVCFFPPAPSFFDSARLVDRFLARGKQLSKWRSTDTLWGIDRLFSMRSREVRAAISTLPPGFHEFLFHPRTLSCPDTQCLLELAQLPSL